MINFDIKCDVCGRTTQGATYIKGICFCAKCYLETFGKNKAKENLKK